MSLWRCGKFALALGQRTYVMGIVNATPDSFSDDGVLGAAALDHALKLVDDGADILDIGGESTRPGAAPVSLDEERRRVLPLLETLAARVNVPISIDTTKAQLAREAIECGASIINDISSGTFDGAMLEVLGASECGVVLMHLRATPQSMEWSTSSRGSQVESQKSLVEEILEFWKERIAAARAAGVADERICLDAGFGFGKSVEENLEIVRRGREFQALGFPVLSALSRKSTIGRVLGDARGDLPVEERIFGTAAATALAIQNGADVIRVHDVKAMKQVACMTDAIVRG